MANTDSTSSNTQPPSPTSPAEAFAQALNIRLVNFENELFQLVCCYHFYHDALQAIVERQEPLPHPRSRWHFGMASIGGWLTNSGDQLLLQLQEVTEWAKQETPVDEPEETSA